MKSMPSKRTNRIERKKKKMAALFEITKLNELDRVKKSKQMTVDEEISVEAEPSPKRLCIEESPILNCDDIKIGPSGKPKLSGEEFIKLKKILRENTDKMRSQPKFRLRDQGENAAISLDAETRFPLFLCDIQHLILYSQVGHHSPYTPTRWCQLDKFNKLISTNVLVIDNISVYHFISNESLFPFLSSTYTHQLEILAPAAYRGDCVQDLATVPLTSTQVRKYVNKYGSLETAVTKCDEVFDIVRNMFHVDIETPANTNLPADDKFPRTHLLLSGWQMVEENFPLPIKGLMENKYKGYVLTKDVYKRVTPMSPMFGLDCEMCKTTSGDLELTRVSIVDEKMEIFYEQLVKPHNKITDFLTRFSGITPKMMKNVTKRIEDVQEEIRRILPGDAILVGQSLSNDMHALKLMHPYIIDTSIIFNITGDRSRKTKLQTLAREFLSERIQEGSGGHCSIEDSAASLKLVQLKLKKDIYFGDAVMSSIQLQARKHPELGNPNFASSMLKQTTRMGKTALVVGTNDISSKYSSFTFKNLNNKNDTKIVFECESSNKTIIDKVSENSTKNSLNIAHIKISEDQYKDNNLQIFQDIDKWVKQIHELSVIPSLNIVIFGGHGTSNGCCFINLKS